MNDIETFSKKAINFDLLTNELKKVYKSNNPFVYMKGYKEIGRFLKSRGFIHRQWSGYISKEPMSNLNVIQIIKDLNKAFPWLKHCVRKFDVTNIGDTFDMMYIFQKADKSKLQEKASEQQASKERPSKKSKGVISRESILRSAKNIAEKEHSPPERKHNRDNSL